MILLTLAVITPILISRYYNGDAEVKRVAQAAVILIALLVSGLWAALASYVLYELLFNSTQKYLKGEVWYTDNETWFGRVVQNKFGDTGTKILFFAEIIISILILL